MSKSVYIHSKPLLGLFFLLFSLGALSQDIIFNTPEVDVNLALCRTSSSSNVNIKLPFTGASFNEANDFFVELSDENGDFDNLVNVAILTDQSLNSAFLNAEGSFSLPEGTAGDGYRIQIRSTDPVLISPSSEPFSAYVQPEEVITVNNAENLTICNGTPTDISITLNDPEVNVDDYKYAWFFNNIQIEGENGSTLTVDTPGFYTARYFLGIHCTLSGTRFNTIEVFDANVEQIFIDETRDTISLCANETEDLEATVDNPSYNYTWLKDGDVLASGYIPVFTTPLTDQYGTYQLIVNVGDCAVESQEILIQPQEGATFALEIESALTRVLLPTETITLTVVVTPTSDALSYQWFKDGEALFNTQPEINIVTDGEYFVEVIDTSSTCAVAVTSEIYTFLDATSLEPLVRVDDYDECNSSTALLTNIGVNAIATDGLSYSLTTEQLELLTFQWLFNSTALTGEDDATLNVVSYLNNGGYSLNATAGGGVTQVAGSSIEENILLSPNSQITSSSVSNKLCPGSVINLSIENLPGFTYKWFDEDDVELVVTDTTGIEVREPGSYYVVYDGFGCSNVTETIEILDFDEDVLVLDPESRAVLIAESTVVLSATGADSYEWFNENGDLVSNNNTLETGVLGIYTVVGSVEDCQVSKEIEVVADDGSFIIPNIISPLNGDNVNDTWNIPNKFSFQSDVQVIIYNSKGTEILNTFDYQNNWPQTSLVRGGSIFYFKVIQQENLIKAGTISVLE